MCVCLDWTFHISQEGFEQHQIAFVVSLTCNVDIVLPELQDTLSIVIL